MRPKKWFASRKAHFATPKKVPPGADRHPPHPVSYDTGYNHYASILSACFFTQPCIQNIL